MIGLLLAFIFGTTQLFASSSEYRYLDDLALESGADKGSNYHNYTEIYARYFAPLKDQPIKLLEIGIYKGSSVKLWEKYFPFGELNFVDITFDHVEYFSKKSHYFLANQESPEELQKVVAKTGGEFDIIIDDGGHTMNQQIVSFRTLFPYVKSGGIYIIEDLHTSYWREYGGGGRGLTTIHFLKTLIDDLNYVGAKTKRASHLNLDAELLQDLNLYREKIESIHFYDSIAIILKR